MPMGPHLAHATDPAVRISLDLLAGLLAGYGPRDFAVRFWDAGTWPADAGREARFTLALNHPGALRAMLLPPNRLTVGEAYLFGDYDVEGDLEAFFGLLAFWSKRRRGLLAKLSLFRRLRRLPAAGRARAGRAARLRGAVHSPERERQAIQYHYDVSNEFYALWLDCRRVYSCAYFSRPDEDLDTAQLNKLEHTCRKLGLRPGMKLLDIGCGWGGLILHAAKQHGAVAVGITLSQRQQEHVEALIRREGLAGRCRVELRDYRAVTEAGGFDRLVSVGMAEHVGAALLPTYFRQALRLLKPGGLLLHHAIAFAADHRMPPGPSFAKRYVFPDGELVPLHQTLRAAEDVGLEVRDVESLREHYALTLRHWRRRLLAQADEARRLTSAVTFRIWDYYLAGAACLFDNATLTIYQTLLHKPSNGPSGLPLTRAHWYAGSRPAPGETAAPAQWHDGGAPEAVWRGSQWAEPNNLAALSVLSSPEQTEGQASSTGQQQRQP
jgi:cyclopropane-fatty-acyl-phospholipid synthase